MTTTNMKTGWGKPKYGGQGFVKTGTPQEGDNTFRILPPMHSLAESGKWAIYESTHWGYFGVNSDPKGKPIARPFRCIKVTNRKTQLVEVECPACTQYDEQVAVAEAQLASLKAAGTSEEETKTVMASINGWLGDHRPERKWYVNVMLPDGTFCDYKLNHKFHKKGIDALIQKYQEIEGKDPLDLDDGCWFNIARTGKKINVVDVVDFAKDWVEVSVQGKLQKVAVTRTSALTEEQKVKALETCRDLTKLGGTVLSYDQIFELVNCDQEPETVDKIMGISKERSAASNPTSASNPATALKAAPASKAQALPNQTADKSSVQTNEGLQKPTSALANKPAVDQSALAARAAAILAKRKAAEEAEKAAKAAAEAAASAPPVLTEDMDDDAFMKFFDQQPPA